MSKKEIRIAAQKEQLLRILGRRPGCSHKMPAKTLAAVFRCSQMQLHGLVNALRMDGIAVCGHPHGGYFIAETTEEMEETCRFLRDRAMQSLILESKMWGIPSVNVLAGLAASLTDREAYHIGVIRPASMAQAGRPR